MSAFIVNNTTLNKAVFAMTQEPSGVSTRWNGWAFSHEDADKLKQKLHDLNVRAVRARYPHDDFTAEPVQRYRHQHHAWTDALKSLDCLIYQCSESNVPEDDLYKQMQKQASAVCRFIVETSPDYQAAKWGN